MCSITCRKEEVAVEKGAKLCFEHREVCTKYNVYSPLARNAICTHHWPHYPSVPSADIELNFLLMQIVNLIDGELVELEPE